MIIPHLGIVFPIYEVHVGSFIFRKQPNTPMIKKAPRKFLASLSVLSLISAPLTAHEGEEGHTHEEEVAVELLPELEGVGAFLSIASGLRSLEFSQEEFAIVTTSFTAAMAGENPGAEVLQGMRDTAQFMRDRFESIENEAELTAPSELTCQTIGFMIATQSRLAELEFSKEEIAQIAKGLEYGLDASKDPAAIRAEIPNVQQFLTERQQKLAAVQAEKMQGELAERRVEMAAFFEKIATEEGIEKDESGFYFKVTEAGEGDKPTMSDSVEVHYKGTLIDGTVFDSSFDRGAPATFPMNGVIKGFSGGLSKIAAGGKVTIYIPSDLGYGDNPRPGGVIKPGDALIFECELIKVNP